MNLKMYSIYDDQAQAYVTPFFMQNDGLAIRAFSDNTNAKDDNNIAKHPEQFSLYQVGEWNDKKGLVEPLEQPRFMYKAIELKDQEPEVDIILRLDELSAQLNAIKQAVLN